MKLKDLLLVLSSYTHVDIYDSAGVLIATACAEQYKHYIHCTKLENSRKRLKPMYYAKVAYIWPDDLDYTGDWRVLGVKIDYEE